MMSGELRVHKEGEFVQRPIRTELVDHMGLMVETLGGRPVEQLQ